LPSSDAGYSLNEAQTETGTLENVPAAMNIGAKRERARLADFNDGRPFDPIKRWYRFNLHGTN
jgi:hypothetical protein